MMEFYLLRPWWLLALIPAIACFYFLLRQRNNHSRWSQVIDNELLDALLENGLPQKARWPLWCLLAGWTLSALALSGPCFEKQTHAAMKQADAVVVLLDLSPSMLASDVTPSRLQAAHYKILDLLRQRKEGYTALIAYSGSAHVVAPLSDDANTVAALVTTLEPAIMPSLGSQAEDAVSEALQLLENSHFARGRLLLISDGIIPQAADNINRQLQGKPVELHVIGVGSAQGGPVALANGGFMKDNSGKVQTFAFDNTALQQLAHDNNGYYSDLRSDDSDIAALIALPSWLAQLSNSGTDKSANRDGSHTIEHWQDAGYWLLIPCLLIALMAFRRGVLVCLLPLLLATMPHRSEALEWPALDWPEREWQEISWQNLWKTPDQQGAASLQQGDAAKAATQFNNPEWKAFAEYQSNQHEQAAEHFAAADSAAAHYNRGNALARANKLDDAINAYDEALKRQPDLADAKANQALVKKLLQQQEQQQEKQKQEQQNKDKQNTDDQNQQDQQGDEQETGQDSEQNSNQQQDGEKNQSDSESKSNSDSDKSGNEKPDSGKQDNENPTGDKSKNESESVKQDGQAKADSDKSNSEKSEPEKSEPEKSDAEKADEAKKSTNAAQPDSKARGNQEKQQAVEHLLRKVPDDPGGLLKNKFEYYYKLNRQQEAQDRRSGNASQEEQRW